MLPNSSRLFGLDVIRSIAISLVVISHCTFLLFPESTNTIITAIRVNGAIGVDLFFILSGYLIGGILLIQIENGKTKFTHLITFWKRRWFRTLPNYFLILLLNVVLYLVLAKPLLDETWLFVPFLQNFSSPHPNFFTEAWSLSVEEYAYLLLPFLCFVGFHLFNRIDKKQLYLITTILSIVGLMLIKVVYFFNAEVNTYFDWSSSFRKVVIYRMDSIYIGFLLIYISREIPNYMRRNRYLLLFLGLIIFIGTHLFIYYLNVMPQTHLVFYVFCYLELVIISLALLFPYFVSLKSKGFLNKLVYYISTRSYAIYLVNYSLVLLTIKHFFNTTSLSLIDQILGLITYLSISILLSEFLYRYFESPILKYRDRILTK